MYLKWKEECMFGEKRKEKINILLQKNTNLITTISELKQEVTLLNYKLEGMTKSVHILNYGSDTLN